MACDECGFAATFGREDGEDKAKIRPMVQMEPGRDGKPWELCARCWISGTRHDKLGNIKARDLEPPPNRRNAAATNETADSISQFSYTGKTGTFVPDEDNFW